MTLFKLLIYETYDTNVKSKKTLYLSELVTSLKKRKLVFKNKIVKMTLNTRKCGPSTSVNVGG